VRIQDLGFRIQARAQSRILDPKGRSKQDAGTQGTDCLAEGYAVGGCRLQTHQVFSQTEIYGLASQLQRAAVSIPLNIAEGHGLKQTQAYARHLAIANGSLAELETQLEIANRLGYLGLESRRVIDQASEVRRMLSGLRRSLQSRLAVAES